MITIRKEQMESIANAQIKDFENRVMEHLKDSFPHRVGKMHEHKLRQIVKAGIQEAGDNDITVEQEVVAYIDLSIVQGEGFAAEVPGGIPSQEEDIRDE